MFIGGGNRSTRTQLLTQALLTQGQAAPRLKSSILRLSSKSGWQLRSIHISNDNGSFTFYVDVFFPLSLPIPLSYLTVYISNTYKKQELHVLREHLSSPPFFLVGSVLPIFLVFCVVLLCVYVLSSVLWCPLRCSHINYARFVFTTRCLYGVHVFFTLCVCVFAHIVLWFFFVCLSCVLCTLCCQFLWNIQFGLLLQYSDVCLTVLWIFHPSQTSSTLQFEKHASQKQLVSFITIPPSLRQ